ncbi:unnamed protein product [Schistocephalus solidus]|uniref:Reverse transcriptase domain-containing protein n=1 Tax=Schistocephalus solidus TaxID=70667 RepID=A0A183TC08_SCHSO|nr:unnamed protein product [Schistocephalus solidus]
MVSEAFGVTNGVKQGCVLAPNLFSLMFSAMLMDAYRDEPPWIRITYRTDGHLLNSRRMQAPTRVSTTTAELTGTFSTVGVCRPQRACLRLRSMNFSLWTTAPLTP